jgi:hypothetical protein
MKIIKFLGGLGNQMFQYAFYKSLTAHGKTTYADVSAFKDYKLHNGLEIERIFDIKLKKANPFFSKLLKPHQGSRFYRKLKRILFLKKSYREETTEFCFNPSLFNLRGHHYFWGYWQHEDYFKNISIEIRKDFTFKQPLNVTNQNALREIQSGNSIGIHVRRGDYVNDPLLGGLCNLDYYTSAIKTCNIRIQDPKFYVFSDDINWCRENLSTLGTMYFIDWNKGNESFVDMQLMSNCKHQIIANSSFSWWAAWLNENPDKVVIAPKKWINNSTSTLALKEWIKI